MNIKLRLALLLAIFLYYIVLYYLVKRKMFSVKYVILWLISGFLMLIFVLFPSLLDLFTKVVGIIEPTNGLFSIFCFCVLIILMTITAIVSSLSEKNKKLCQNIALLEKRLRDIENKL